MARKRGIMTDWPNVDIIVITYDRLDEILSTVESLETYLQYDKSKLHYIIADDNTPGDYLTRMFNTSLFMNLESVRSAPSSPNLGWGGNANRAMKYSAWLGISDYMLFLEDDRPLRAPLNLYNVMALMEVKQEIGLLRLAGTSGLPYVYHQLEADVSEWLPEYREGMSLPGKMNYCLLGSGSPTLWLYSNQPHLKRRSFHEKFYGFYPEGLRLGATEETFCHTVVDLMRANINSYPAIAVQPDFMIPRFDHIGRSYQHTELDIERIKA